MSKTNFKHTQHPSVMHQYTLENTEGAIKNRKSRKTDNIGYTRRRQRKQNTTQYELDTTTNMRKRTQVTYIRHELSYKQPSICFVLKYCLIALGGKFDLLCLLCFSKWILINPYKISSQE